MTWLIFASSRKGNKLYFQLGYTGPGWVHRCLAEHLLHFGIITWDDISYTFEASGHLPAGIFNKPLTMMQEAWEGLEDAEVLDKQSVNSLIGGH